MNLTEFEGICFGQSSKQGFYYCIDNLCLDIEGSTISANEALIVIEKRKTELQVEYDAKGKNLAEDCKRRKTEDRKSNSVGAHRAWKDEHYQKALYIINKIKAVINALRWGETDYSENEQRQLLSALNGLNKYCSYLSNICQAVMKENPATLNRIIANANNSPLTPQEIIESDGRAMELAQRLQDNGYLDNCYFPTKGLTLDEKAVIANCFYTVIPKWASYWGKYWGIKSRDLQNKYNRALDSPTKKVQELTKLVNH